MSFWEAFWATFAGGLAAALVSILGIVIVERIRAGQEKARERRASVDRRLERRRASRNAAKAVRMEIFAAERPLLRFLGKHSGWEPMRVETRAWDDRDNRVALIDALTDDALFNIEHAYRELAAVERRLEEDPSFLAHLSADDGKLGKQILALHVDPATNDLDLAIAAIETLELAARGELQKEAARVGREESMD